jgi:hypothetical protein
MRSIIKAALWAMSTAIGLGACAGHNLLGQVVDDNLYVGGVAQPKGPVAIGKNYSFRFVEKWRISHAWLQGTGVRPCLYPLNVFRRIPGYPALASEPNAPMFERDGKVYTGTTFERNPGQIVFGERSYELLGERRSGDRRFEGKYTPFCSQPFSSPNGMALWIVKPDIGKGTGLWVEGAIPTEVNGRTWLVKKVPSVDLGPASDLASPMEYWTLKIPETPYWLHMRFSGSRRSVEQYAAEHEHLLNLFHQLIESVKLEPIAPVDPASMPPFVLYEPQAAQGSSR